MTQTWYEVTTTIEAAFGNGPYDASPTWTDITEWVREPLQINRGRTSEYSSFAPGTASLVLDNRDRRFDPTHASGPYFGDLNPMTPIRVRHETWFISYYGFITGFPQDLGKGYTDGTARIRCVDAFRLIGQTDLLGSGYANAVVTSPRAPSNYWPMQETRNREYVDIIGGRIIRSAFGGDVSENVAVPVGAPNAVSVPRNTDPLIPGVASNPIVLGDGEGARLDTAPRSVEAWIDIANVYVLNDALAVAGFEVRMSTLSDGWMHVYALEDASTGFVKWRVDYTNTADAKYTISTMTGPRVKVGLQHVVATADNTNVKLYIDGVEVASQALDSGTFAFTQTTVLLAADAESRISHVATYADTLTAADVAAHYDAGLTGYGHPVGERGGARIGRVLDEVGIPSALRDLSTGDTVLGPYDSGGDALGYCRQIEKAEQGLFFVSREGKVTFRDRNWQFARSSEATFGDCDNGGLPFRDIRPDSNTVANIRNVAEVTWAEGTVTRKDDASIDAYGRNGESIVTRLIPSPNIAQTLGAYIVRTRKDPATRIEYLKVLPRRDPDALFPFVLTVELGDVITVVLTPLNVGEATTYVLAVQGIRHTITRKTWETDLYLAPADIGPYFTVGDATLGRIGTAADNRIPY